MRAVRLHGPGDLRVDEVEEFPLQEGTVRVEPAYVGICGSDIHEYKIGPVPIRAEDKNHVIPESEWDEYLPKWMGHEISGVVTEVGDGVESLAVGDEVAMGGGNGCGECQYCAVGKSNLCVYGNGAIVNSAGFADNLVLPEDRATRIPEDLSLRYAALAEPLGVSMHGYHRGKVSVGDSIAVFGAGPIGLGVIAAANAGGAGEIYVSEPLESRREVAAEMGADHLLDPTEVDARTEIREATDGVDVAFETAGVGPALTDALRTTKHDGRVVVLSVFEDETSIHPNDLMQAERKLVGSLGFTGGPDSAFETVMEFMADGRIDPEPLITGEVDLDGTEDAFESLLEPDTDHVKVLVEP